MTEDRAADALQEKARTEFARRFQHYDGYRSPARQDDLFRVFLSGMEYATEDLPALLAAEREKALLAVQSYSGAELAAERERGRVDGLREAHRQILGLLGAPAPADLAEPAPGEEASRG